MYQSYWGLAESPFQGRLDPSKFYESPTHEEALARLDFLVKEHRRLGLVMGPAGSGKSFVLEVFASRLRGQGSPVAAVSAFGVESVEFLGQVAVGFGLNPGPGLATAGLWRLLSDRIAEFRYQRMETVLLVDDADSAGRDVVVQLTRLAKSDPGPDSLLTIVLAGQPDRIGRLGPGLLELAELRIDLEPWEPSDTVHFIEAALQKAGRTTPVFAEPAIERLHQLAQGVPRRVSQLADLALVAGAGRTLDSIDADTIDSVCQELGVIKVNDEG